MKKNSGLTVAGKVAVVVVILALVGVGFYATRNILLPKAKQSGPASNAILFPHP